MTNEQRRLALAKARLKAYEHAEVAEGVTNEEIYGPRDRKLANMWAGVAQALKNEAV